jgi:DNA-directed RNA polymerase subunit RPC12/RpoP
MTRVYHVEEFRPTDKYECITCHNETEDAYIVADHKDEAKQKLENGEVQCPTCALDNIMENFVLASTAE